jgi:DNA-3-methyladenine glycosylase
MENKILTKEFYIRETPIVARELLGKLIWRNTDKGMMVARIVETEAYLAENDPACHAFYKKTKKNEKMFEEGGISYVYFIYGCYFCLNIVTGQKDRGEAVLIRALEPIDGIKIMKEFRPVEKERELTNGPGKLCKALNINIDDNGIDVIKSKKLFLSEDINFKDTEIVVTTRIGITKGTELPLRFYLMNNKYVSKVVK